MRQTIDEYTLAAFLAGTLPDSRREEVARYLAQHEDARELLQMAHEAMEAVRETDEVVSEPAAQPAPLQLPRKPQRRARPAAPSHRAAAPVRSHTAHFRRFAAAAVLVFSVGLGLRLAFGPPTDALRSQQSSMLQQDLTVEVSTSDLSFQWTEIPEAYRYRIVVYDVQEALVVTRHETSSRSLAEDTNFVQHLQSQLVPGHTYTFRVDAIDAENRLIESSDAIPFALSP